MWDAVVLPVWAGILENLGGLALSSSGPTSRDVRSWGLSQGLRFPCRDSGPRWAMVRQAQANGAPPVSQPPRPDRGFPSAWAEDVDYRLVPP